MERQYKTNPNNLEMLGIDAIEEVIYRTLIQNPGSTVAEISDVVGLSSRPITQVLSTMISKGLLSKTHGHQNRYHAVAPDIALESLLHKCTRRLQGMQARIDKFKSEYRSAVQLKDQEQPIEVLARDTNLELQVFVRIQEAAEREVLTLERPPVRLTSLGTQDPIEWKSLARGVRYRSIADRELLALPKGPLAVMNSVQSGDETRIYPHLPFKMLLVDRRIALVPLAPELDQCPFLLVRAKSVLNALHALFELLWEKSIGFYQHANPEQVYSVHRDEDCQAGQDRLLTNLLVAGLNDKSIQYEMGVSASTLNRRIKALMKATGASSRFQLGWILARQSASLSYRTLGPPQ